MRVERREPAGVRPGRHRRYSTTQVRAVLNAKGTFDAIAAATGVAKATVAKWRSGDLPSYFDEWGDGVPVARASRFINPADARAGR